MDSERIQRQYDQQVALKSPTNERFSFFHIISSPNRADPQNGRGGKYIDRIERKLHKTELPQQMLHTYGKWPPGVDCSRSFGKFSQNGDKRYSDRLFKKMATGTFKGYSSRLQKAPYFQYYFEEIEKVIMEGQNSWLTLTQNYWKYL